ncbi:MAG TPA: hypothetical protein VNB54_12450 [Alphaproteobacteria bacterium]|nr:hypothetical protein [Alphaproteobacteria bacterium]
MTEEEAIEKFGLLPKAQELPAIRQLLMEAKLRRAPEPLMRLLCIQLFAHGDVEDSLLVWRAKRSSFDAGSGIDVQLMCGAGLQATKKYLGSIQSAESAAALEYLHKCEQAGDFKDWSPAKHLEFWLNYYRQ